MFITGGAHGIGRATAEAYAARGAKICILDRADIKDAPPDWVCLKGSATSAEDTEKALAEMDRRWGGVDVAFANAGMAANKPSLDLTEAEWQAVLDLNLTGVFLTCQAAGRRMVEQKSGLILATSSIYGLTAGARRAAYTATKAAVIAGVKRLSGAYHRSGLRSRYLRASSRRAA